MKTAIVYDRVNKWGGAERVLLTLHEMFPKAPLYTSVYNAKTAEWASVFPEVHTSFLQKLLLSKTRHELLAPLMPLAFESFNFDNYDLVISVTSEAAKGVITRPGTLHVCYMLTPTRYLWSGYDEYFKSQVLKGVSKPIVNHLRQWDKIAAQRPDVVVGISSEIKKRIKNYYGRESELVYPPVELSHFGKAVSKINISKRAHIKSTSLDKQSLRLRQRDVGNSAQERDNRGGYYLVVSRLVTYKRVDLAINTFNGLGKKLVVVGTGREETRLKEMAADNIIFTSHLTDKELLNYYINARALIFPQVEDFGLVAVEAQTAGTPVIAYKAGGVLDTVVDGKTGILFNEQTKKSLIEAIKKFENTKFVESDMIKNTQIFSRDRFKREFLLLIDQLI